MQKSKDLFAAAVKHYEDAIELLPADERNKPIKQQIAGVSAAAPLHICSDIHLVSTTLALPPFNSALHYHPDVSTSPLWHTSMQM